MTRRAVHNGQASIARGWRLPPPSTTPPLLVELCPLLGATITGADGRANCLLMGFCVLLAFVRVFLGDSLSCRALKGPPAAVLWVGGVVAWFEHGEATAEERSTEAGER